MTSLRALRLNKCRLVTGAVKDVTKSKGAVELTVLALPPAVTGSLSSVARLTNLEELDLAGCSFMKGGFLEDTAQMVRFYKQISNLIKCCQKKGLYRH